MWLKAALVKALIQYVTDEGLKLCEYNAAFLQTPRRRSPVINGDRGTHLKGSAG